MKISLAELTIITDTLFGSLKVFEEEKYFKFSLETRQKVASNLLGQMNEEILNVELENG